MYTKHRDSPSSQTLCLTSLLKCRNRPLFSERIFSPEETDQKERKHLNVSEPWVPQQMIKPGQPYSKAQLTPHLLAQIFHF